jgi:hypothetical protein
MEVVPVAGEQLVHQPQAGGEAGDALQVNPGAGPVKGDTEVARALEEALRMAENGAPVGRMSSGSNCVAGLPAAAFSIARNSSSYSRFSPQGAPESGSIQVSTMGGRTGEPAPPLSPPVL